MPTRAVVLLSGGLDSRLAVRILQEQDIEVEGLNFRTIFTCCQDGAAQSARDLGVRLTIVGQDDDYLDLIKAPKYGYGKGANPCVDCRIYMFQRARKFMEEVGASFVASGEVVGQRPMSQKRGDLATIAVKSELDELLLRPLSAKLLSPTRPEREGLVDRTRLYAFNGRSRKGLIELARRFGFAESEIPTPSTGCSLTERLFGLKVHDLVQLAPQSKRWDFELLKVGRHFRLDEQTKIIVGRSEADNNLLEYMAGLPDAAGSALMIPENFNGPVTLVIAPAPDAAIEFAGGLILRYSREFPDEPQVMLQRSGARRLHAIYPHAGADVAPTICSSDPPRRASGAVKPAMSPVASSARDAGLGTCGSS